MSARLAVVGALLGLLVPAPTLGEPPAAATGAEAFACVDAEVEGTPCELWELAEAWRARALHAEAEMERWKAKTSTRSRARIRSLVPVPASSADDDPAWCPGAGTLIGGGAVLCMLCGVVGGAIDKGSPNITVVVPK